MSKHLTELVQAVEPFGLHIDTMTHEPVTRYRFFTEPGDKGVTTWGIGEARLYVKGLMRGAVGKPPND